MYFEEILRLKRKIVNAESGEKLYLSDLDKEFNIPLEEIEYYLKHYDSIGLGIYRNPMNIEQRFYQAK